MVTIPYYHTFVEAEQPSTKKTTKTRHHIQPDPARALKKQIRGFKSDGYSPRAAICNCAENQSLPPS